jgi:hypothetical protein
MGHKTSLIPTQLFSLTVPFARDLFNMTHKTSMTYQTNDGALEVENKTLQKALDSGIQKPS